MIKSWLKSFTLMMILGCGLQNYVFAQQLQVLNFEKFEPYMHRTGDTLYVINFWATWCGPCVKELPLFESLLNEYKGEKIKVLLVSLDDSKTLETRIKPFIKAKDLRCEVIVLDDPNFNSWIDKVNPAWTGAIPSTLVYRGSDIEFFEQEFTWEELNEIIKSKFVKP